MFVLNEPTQTPVNEIENFLFLSRSLSLEKIVQCITNWNKKNKNIKKSRWKNVNKLIATQRITDNSVEFNFEFYLFFSLKKTRREYDASALERSSFLMVFVVLINLTKFFFFFKLKTKQQIFDFVWLYQAQMMQIKPEKKYILGCNDSILSRLHCLLFYFGYLFDSSEAIENDFAPIIP